MNLHKKEKERSLSINTRKSKNTKGLIKTRQNLIKNTLKEKIKNLLKKEQIKNKIKRNLNLGVNVGIAVKLDTSVMNAIKRK